MCFSASASFIAGVGLSAVGIATLRMNSRRTEIPFALIPFLFGLQQIIEGMIWLSFEKETLISNHTLTLVYSVFSHVLWPMFVPFAVGRVETDAWRKKALYFCQIAGVLVGLYLLYYIVQYPVTSRVLGQHIVYESPHFYVNTVLVLYFISTCMSGMLSSNNIIRLFGVLAVVTFLAAYAIHVATLVSVWCFFAAILSFMVYFYMREARKVSDTIIPITAQ